MRRVLVLSLAVLILSVAGFVFAGSQTAEEKARQEELRKLPPYKRLLTGDDAKKAAELEKKIAELEETDKYAKAIQAGEELLGLRQRVQGADHHEALSVKWKIEALRKVAALPVERRAALVAASKSGWAGRQLAERGRYRDAQPLLYTRLDLYREALGEDHPDTAESYNIVAYNLHGQGQYGEAEPLLRKALDICRQTLCEAHPATARGYHNLATNLTEQGKYAEAELLTRKVLDICVHVLGQAHPHTATSFNNLATILSKQGKYAEAEPIHRKALDIRRAMGEDHATAEAYNNLAANLEAQAKYAQAEALFRKSVDIRLQSLGEEHAHTATGYNNLAYVLNRQEKYDQAETLYRKVLDVNRQALGETHPRTAASYSNLASNLIVQAKYAEAEPLLRKALDIHRQSLGEIHPHTATTYNSLAYYLNSQGEYVKAESLLRAALSIRCKVLGEAHPDAARSFDNLVINLNAQGRYTDAERLARAAAANLEAARLCAIASGLERAGAERFSPRRAWAAALLHTGKPEQAWQALEGHFGRGLLDDYSARQGLNVSPENQQRLDQINAKLVQLEKQINNLFNRKGRLEEHRKEFEQLAGQRKKVQDELAHLAAEFNQREVYDLKRIQPLLPKDAALIFWLDIAGHPRAANPDGEHWGFILKAKGCPIVVRITGSGKDGGWTKDDDEFADKVRAALTDRDNPALAGGLARRLAVQRLAPLEPDLKNVKQLIALPSAALRGIPLEALTDRFLISYAPSGTLFARLQERLCERRVDHRGSFQLLAVGDPVFTPPKKPKDLPAPPDHGLYLALVQPDSNAATSGLRRGDVLLQYAGKKLTKQEDLQPAQAGEAVPVQVWREGLTLELKVKPGRLGVGPAKGAAADAVKSAREGDAILAGLTRGPTLTPLPGTRREVEAIASMFPNSQKLLGRAATVSSLRQLAADGSLAKFDVIHLATHGKTDPYVALHSAIFLSQAPDDDGKLTALEMKEWKLNADVVVLSVCESGLGRYSGGDGYLGFTQALFLAGARSVVLSLWKVDDHATALLMVRFYENLLGKRPGTTPMGKAAALKEAKEWLRTRTAAEIDQHLAGLPRGDPRPQQQDKAVPPPRSFEHPYYWAGFILIGDPE